jgi:hypothetical protein
MEMNMSLVSLMNASAWSCLFAFLSALAWTRSATVRVPYSLRDHKDVPVQAPSIGLDERGRFNAQETMRKQAGWNRYAAGFGAAAAMCQMIVTFPL